MPEEDFKTLVSDIKSHGLSTLHPIIIHEDMILDGWHREMACIAAGVTPTYVPFVAPDMAETALEFVIQENLNRRHLDTSQRAMVAAKNLELTLAEETARNSVQPEKMTRNEHVEAIAKSANVSRDSVNEAASLLGADPAEAEKVLQGEKSLHAAKAAAKGKNKAHGAAVRRIEAVLGDSWTKTVKLSDRDLVKMSGLIPEEMQRIKAFLESGWKLSAALGHTSVALLPAHSLRDGILRAMEKGNKHVALMNAEGMEWTITFEGTPISPP